MTHPEELLAAYVDGDLLPPEREEVERHLAACPSCREEVELAGSARSALRALPEAPVPLGVTGPVLQVVEPPSGRWARGARWVGAAAVAAAVVAVVAVVLPEVGREAPFPAAMAPAPGDAAAEAGPGGLRAPPLERRDRDYGPQDLPALAQEAARLAADAVGGEVPPEARTASQEALACVVAGSDLTPEDAIVRLIEARFEGTPAYLVVAHRGPGAGRPPTKVIVWVVAKDGCRTLSFSQGRLPGS